MDLRVSPAPRVAAEAAADYIAACLRDAPHDAPLVLAVSGGTTPGPLYRRLRTLDVPWDRLHVVWVDERVVPHEDARSNTRLVRETLLVDAPIRAANVHPVETAAGGGVAADRYDALLHDLLGEHGVTVAVLGMGDDGHTASLFPGAPLDHGDRLAVHVRAPDYAPVRDRITMTLALLNRSRHVVFLATGASKLSALTDVRAGACPARPAACITAPGTVWFVDMATVSPAP